MVTQEKSKSSRSSLTIGLRAQDLASDVGFHVGTSETFAEFTYRLGNI